MNTIIFDTTDNDLKKASEIIKNGGLVAFPTETVYGLGANTLNNSAVQNIFVAKGRPSDNPLIVHISSFDMLNGIVREIPSSAKILMDAFMPGPITLIMKKNPSISNFVTAGLDTVAVRFPNHEIARKLIEYANVPISAPSANLSGKPSPTIARHVIDDMLGRVDGIINGGECTAGVESTVVDCTGENPVILRPGIITYDDIKQYISSVEIDKHVINTVAVGDTPKSPGMKYKHYAPNANVTVVEGCPLNVKNKITTLIAENQDKKIGVLSCSDNIYNDIFTLKVENGNVGYAHSLFTYLRKFDEEKCDIVFAEFCIFDSLSLSVKNRLYKSADNNIILV